MTTPISETGQNRRAAEQGFTLVELLAVLVIFGLLSAAAIVAMPDPKGSVTVDAQRFAARAKAARDRAIIDGRAVALSVRQDGYSVERRVDGTWRLLESYGWSDGTRAGTARILFDPTGIVEPAAITLNRDGQAAVVEVDGGGGINVHR